MDTPKSMPKSTETEGSALEAAETTTSIAIGQMDDDAAKLAAMGYKPQMKREFNVYELISTAFINTASWLGVTGAFATGVLIGGPAAIVYGLVIVAVFNLFIVTALSELVSAIPNSGGQYVWALELAPKRIARASAYFTGLCNLAGGIVAAAASCILIGYFIMGSVVLYNPELIIHPWQVWLIGVSLYLSISVVNLWQKAIVKASIAGLAMNILAYLIVTIVPPSVTPKHTDVSFIFASTQNISGWSSHVMAFLVGLVNANYSFGVIDTAIHLAEEVPEPERNVPKALYAAVITGFITAWPTAIVLMYCMYDFDDVVETPTFVPLLELFHLALRGNRAGAVALLMLILVCGVFALMALQTYQARICWAFSRDNGLPFSNLWSTVHPKLGVPLKAHILCVSTVVILALLAIASTTAFNSLAAGVIVFPSLSYILPVAYSLLPANKHVKGPFHLGMVGIFCKIATLFFCIATSIIYCFPFVKPVETSNMNYLSAIIGVVFIYGAMDWMFRARKHFRGQHHVPAAAVVSET